MLALVETSLAAARRVRLRPHITSPALHTGKVDVIFFGYIFCVGLSTGVSRQKYFEYFCQKYSEYCRIY
jgi:hypothetical protein